MKQPHKLRKATDAERAAISVAVLAPLVEHGETNSDMSHAFELPPEVNPKTRGSVIGGLVAQGVLIRLGDQHTQRAVAHKRRIGRFTTDSRERVISMCNQLALIVATGPKGPKQMRLF